MIEFDKEDTTFTDEEVHELQEGVQFCTVGKSITTSIPGESFGSITSKFEICGQKPEGFDYQKFCKWLRIQAKYWVQIEYSKQIRGKI